MSRTYILTLSFVFFISHYCLAQTKKIAHRSHSGKDAAFTINGDDNFGLKPEYDRPDTSKKSSAKAKLVKKKKPVKKTKTKAIAIKPKTVKPVSRP